MSDAVLNGLSLRRTEVVVDQLAGVAANDAVTPQLCAACVRLIYFWEDIPLQSKLELPTHRAIFMHSLRLRPHVFIQNLFLNG